MGSFRPRGAEQETSTAHGPPAAFSSEPVVQQFLARVQEAPQRIALVVPEGRGQPRKEVSYEALAAKVRSLAAELSRLRVQRGGVVALALDRGEHQVVAVYATMMLGAAWVPLDPAAPSRRAEEVLRDCSPALLLHQDDADGIRLAACATALGVAAAACATDGSASLVAKIDAQQDVAATEVNGFGKVVNVDKDERALIIYTSGTTGRPKGIEYSHAMLSHGAGAVAELMGLSSSSVAFLKTPYIWAVVEWEFFPVLISGGRLVIGSPTAHKDPQYMAATIHRERVDSLVVAPDVLDVLLEVHEASSELRSLRHVITVGAGLPVALADRFARARQLEASLHNVYGASESSCTVWTLPPEGFDASQWPNRAPVGRPQPGCSVYILDDDLVSVAPGDVGELCFGGQLALGYLDQPELTAQKFLEHPEFGRVYRTGDLARWRLGVIELTGRKDRQVKIRGVRVEPEEIEASLRAFRRFQPMAATAVSAARADTGADADDAHAAARRSGAEPLLSAGFAPGQGGSHTLGGASATAGDLEEARLGLSHVACVASVGQTRELVAFVSPELRQEELEAVRSHLADTLPPYYIPKHIFSKPSLPLLPNGKVDLRSLEEEAGSLVESASAGAGGALVMDSLGRMRNMSRAAILETKVIHRCYAYWMIGVMCDHWNVCGEIGGFCFVENMKGVVPPWVELFMRQVGNDQDMYGFIFLGALQDSRQAGTEGPPRLKLGYADVFCFAVYLLVAWPIPQVLMSIFGADSGIINSACSSNWVQSGCSGHRWYLFMIVWCHVCMAVCQLLRIPGWLQALGHFALGLFGPSKWYDPCGAAVPKWTKWVFAWVIPYADFSRQTGEVECPIMYDWIQWYVFFYVAAFYYSRQGMRLVTALVQRLGCNSAAWAVAAFGAASLLGATQAAFHYPNRIFEQGVGGKDFEWWYVPLELGVNVLQPLLVALSMAWFPFDLSWWGNTTLGTYSSHFYFFEYMMMHVPKLLQWLQPVQGLPQLLVLLALPIAYATTAGPLFHFLLLSPGMLARRLGKLRRRSP
eukprot:TRINITY_DN6198_c0_g1_i1.p1 TRINITY_DN6198_c0_g1~~TRINITY_DN6198_c0_g1_i1.p1  ORF type:complete len:1143 (+),score=238.75 TRINITY_DN6198_c0_g1_i1:317-3430(+)